MIHFWKDKKNKTALRFVAAVVSASFLFTTISAPFAQASFWEQRRQSADALRKNIQKEQTLQLASAAGVPLEPSFGRTDSLSPERVGVDLSREIQALSRNRSDEKTTLDAVRKIFARKSRPAASRHPELPQWIWERVSAYGSVENVRIVPGRPLVIHVQDVHNFLSAQKNIAFMVRGLAESGVQTIGVEGSSGRMSALEKWKLYPDRESLMAAAGYLLSSGFLTGAEVAGLSAAAKGADFFGVEEKDAYLRQVDAFKSSMDKAPGLREWEKRQAARLTVLKEKAYGESLRSLDAAQLRHENGEINLGGWIQFLADRQNPSAGAYPNVRKYLKVYSIEKGLDFARVKIEQSRVLRELSQKLSKEDLISLLEDSLMYRMGTIESGEFYEGVKRKCARAGVSLTPEFSRYVEYVLGVEGIGRNALFKEVKALESDAWKDSAGTREESVVRRLDEDFALARKGLDFTLSPEDWTQFSARKPEILRLEERIASAGSSADASSVLAGSAEAKTVLENAASFNELSEERSKIFIRTLSDRMSETGKTSAILIAGGYHTAGIEKELEGRNLSVVTVRPRLDSAEMKSEKHPLEAFSRDLLPLEKVFMPEAVSIAPEQALGGVNVPGATPIGHAVRGFLSTVLPALAARNKVESPAASDWTGGAVNSRRFDPATGNDIVDVRTAENSAQVYFGSAESLRGIEETAATGVLQDPFDSNAAAVHFALVASARGWFARAWHSIQSNFKAAPAAAKSSLSLIQGSDRYEKYIAPVWESIVLGLLVSVIPVLVAFGTNNSFEADSTREATFLVGVNFILAQSVFTWLLAQEAYRVLHRARGRHLRAAITRVNVASMLVSGTAAFVFFVFGGSVSAIVWSGTAGFTFAHLAQHLVQNIKGPYHFRMSLFGGDRASEPASKGQETPVPSVAVISGPRLEDTGIEAALQQLKQGDTLVIGGGIAYLFITARYMANSGMSIEYIQRSPGTMIGLVEEFAGATQVNPDELPLAFEILTRARKAGVDLLLPIDHVVSDKKPEDGKVPDGASLKSVEGEKVPAMHYAVDTGPNTKQMIEERLLGANVIAQQGAKSEGRLTLFKGSALYERLIAPLWESAALAVVIVGLPSALLLGLSKSIGLPDFIPAFVMLPSVVLWSALVTEKFASMHGKDTYKKKISYEWRSFGRLQRESKSLQDVAHGANRVGLYGYLIGALPAFAFSFVGLENIAWAILVGMPAAAYFVMNFSDHFFVNNEDRPRSLWLSLLKPSGSAQQTVTPASRLHPIRTISDLAESDIRGKVVLANIDVIGQNPFDESIALIRHLKENGASRIVLIAHAGKDAEGNPVSVTHAAATLGELLGEPVNVVPGNYRTRWPKRIHETVVSAKDGSIVVLPNVLGHRGEAIDNADFSREVIASVNPGLYVQESVGALNRAPSASSASLPRLLNNRKIPVVAGMSVEKEYRRFTDAFERAQAVPLSVETRDMRPLAAVMFGGRKSNLSSEFRNAVSLLQKGDRLIVTGGMVHSIILANHIIKNSVDEARGRSRKAPLFDPRSRWDLSDLARNVVGFSDMPMDFVRSAVETLKLAQSRGVEVVLPREGKEPPSQGTSPIRRGLEGLDRILVLTGSAYKIEDDNSASNGTRSLAYQLKEAPGRGVRIIEGAQAQKTLSERAEVISANQDQINAKAEAEQALGSVANGAFRDLIEEGNDVWWRSNEILNPLLAPEPVMEPARIVSQAAQRDSFENDEYDPQDKRSLIGAILSPFRLLSRLGRNSGTDRMSLVTGSSVYEKFVAPFWESPLLSLFVAGIPAALIAAFAGSETSTLQNIIAVLLYNAAAFAFGQVIGEKIFLRLHGTAPNTFPMMVGEGSSFVRTTVVPVRGTGYGFIQANSFSNSLWFRNADKNLLAWAITRANQASLGAGAIVSIALLAAGLPAAAIVGLSALAYAAAHTVFHFAYNSWPGSRGQRMRLKLSPRAVIDTDEPSSPAYMPQVLAIGSASGRFNMPTSRIHELIGSRPGSRWIEDRLDIQSRRFAHPEEDMSVVAVRAVVNMILSHVGSLSSEDFLEAVEVIPAERDRRDLTDAHEISARRESVNTFEQVMSHVDAGSIAGLSGEERIKVLAEGFLRNHIENINYASLFKLQRSIEEEIAKGKLSSDRRAIYEAFLQLKSGEVVQAAGAKRVQMLLEPFNQFSDPAKALSVALDYDPYDAVARAFGWVVLGKVKSLSFSTSTTEREVIPSGSVHQAALVAYGMEHVPVHSGNNVCGGMGFALEVAHAPLARGEETLLITFGGYSDILNLAEYTSGPLFGDMAMAAVVGPPNPDRKINGFVVRPYLHPATWTSGIPRGFISQTGPNNTFTMDNATVGGAFADQVLKVFVEFLDRHGLTVDDLSAIAIHQPQKGLIRTIAENLGVGQIASVKADGSATVEKVSDKNEAKVFWVGQELANGEAAASGVALSLVLRARDQNGQRLFQLRKDGKPTLVAQLAFGGGASISAVLYHVDENGAKIPVDETAIDLAREGQIVPVNEKAGNIALNAATADSLYPEPSAELVKSHLIENLRHRGQAWDATKAKAHSFEEVLMVGFGNQGWVKAYEFSRMRSNKKIYVMTRTPESFLRGLEEAKAELQPGEYVKFLKRLGLTETSLRRGEYGNWIPAAEMNSRMFDKSQGLLKNVKIVFEATAEDMEVKSDLIGQVWNANPGIGIVTNTSSLNVLDLARIAAEKAWNNLPKADQDDQPLEKFIEEQTERIIAQHDHSPARNNFDNISDPRKRKIDPALYASIAAFDRANGKAITYTDDKFPLFDGNRMVFGGAVREALTLISEGYSLDEIHDAATQNARYEDLPALGFDPIEMILGVDGYKGRGGVADRFEQAKKSGKGLPVTYHILQNHQKYYAAAAREWSDIVSWETIQASQAKTDWTNSREERVAHIRKSLYAALWAEQFRAIQDGAVRHPRWLDFALTHFGLNLRTGGLLQLADDYKLTRVVDMMRELANQPGHKHLNPQRFVRDMVEAKQTFESRYGWPARSEIARSPAGQAILWKQEWSRNSRRYQEFLNGEDLLGMSFPKMDVLNFSWTGLSVEPGIAAKYKDIFGVQTINGRKLIVEQTIADLTRKFSADFDRVLAARSAFRDQVADGSAEYGFADPDAVMTDADGRILTVAQIRQGMVDHMLGRNTPEAWKLNANVTVSKAALKPGLQGTGPFNNLDMAMGALNTGAYGAVSWMADWEDAGNDIRDNFYQAWTNLRQLARGEWDQKAYIRPKDGKKYELTVHQYQRPVIFHRVPGLHLNNRQMTVDGKKVPGMIAAMVINVLNNYQAQTHNGNLPYMYVPKIETPEEALLVSNLLKSIEETAGLRRGALKIEMLHERGRYTANQEIIMWILRENLIGPNVGRWDYINSRIEMGKDDPNAVFPDPHTVGMTDASMTEYTRRNALLTLLVNGFPIGGMSAVMKSKDAPKEINDKAVRSIWFDKLRERLTGLFFIDGEMYDTYRQSWVATTEEEYVRAGAEPLQADYKDLPDLIKRLDDTERSRLVSLGLINLDGDIIPYGVNVGRMAEDLFSNAAWNSLFQVPEGQKTETGLRYAIYMASEYMFQILNGNFAAAIDDPLTGNRLMNDLATFEIFWHWLYTMKTHGTALTHDGAGIQEGDAWNSLGYVPSEAFTRAGDPAAPELFKALLAERRAAVSNYFAAHPENSQGFDRSLADVTMDLLERMLDNPEWITYGSRILYSVIEKSPEEREQIFDAVLSSSREETAEKVLNGEWSPAALEARDYVYDHFEPRSEPEVATVAGVGRQSDDATITEQSVQDMLARVTESFQTLDKARSDAPQLKYEISIFLGKLLAAESGIGQWNAETISTERRNDLALAYATLNELTVLIFVLDHPEFTTESSFFSITGFAQLAARARQSIPRAYAYFSGRRMNWGDAAQREFASQHLNAISGDIITRLFEAENSSPRMTERQLLSLFTLIQYDIRQSKYAYDFNLIKDLVRSRLTLLSSREEIQADPQNASLVQHLLTLIDQPDNAGDSGGTITGQGRLPYSSEISIRHPFRSALALAQWGIVSFKEFRHKAAAKLLGLTVLESRVGKSEGSVTVTPGNRLQNILFYLADPVADLLIAGTLALLPLTSIFFGPDSTAGLFVTGALAAVALPFVYIFAQAGTKSSVSDWKNAARLLTGKSGDQALVGRTGSAAVAEAAVPIARGEGFLADALRLLNDTGISQRAGWPNFYEFGRNNPEAYQAFLNYLHDEIHQLALGTPDKATGMGLLALATQIENSATGFRLDGETLAMIAGMPAVQQALQDIGIELGLEMDETGSQPRRFSIKQKSVSDKRHVVLAMNLLSGNAALHHESVPQTSARGGSNTLIITDALAIYKLRLPKEVSSAGVQVLLGQVEAFMRNKKYSYSGLVELEVMLAETRAALRLADKDSSLWSVQPDINISLRLKVEEAIRLLHHYEVLQDMVLRGYGKFRKNIESIAEHMSLSAGGDVSSALEQFNRQKGRWTPDTTRDYHAFNSKILAGKMERAAKYTTMTGRTPEERLRFMMRYSALVEVLSGELRHMPEETIRELVSTSLALADVDYDMDNALNRKRMNELQNGVRLMVNMIESKLRTGNSAPLRTVAVLPALLLAIPVFGLPVSLALAAGSLIVLPLVLPKMLTSAARRAVIAGKEFRHLAAARLLGLEVRGVHVGKTSGSVEVRSDSRVKSLLFYLVDPVGDIVLAAAAFLAPFLIYAATGRDIAAALAAMAALPISWLFLVSAVTGSKSDWSNVRNILSGRFAPGTQTGFAGSQGGVQEDAAGNGDDFFPYVMNALSLPGAVHRAGVRNFFEFEQGSEARSAMIEHLRSRFNIDSRYHNDDLDSLIFSLLTMIIFNEAGASPEARDVGFVLDRLNDDTLRALADAGLSVKAELSPNEASVTRFVLSYERTVLDPMDPQGRERKFQIEFNFMTGAMALYHERLALPDNGRVARREIFSVDAAQTFSSVPETLTPDYAKALISDVKSFVLSKSHTWRDMSILESRLSEAIAAVELSAKGTWREEGLHTPLKIDLKNAYRGLLLYAALQTILIEDTNANYQFWSSQIKAFADGVRNGKFPETYDTYIRAMDAARAPDPAAVAKFTYHVQDQMLVRAGLLVDELESERGLSASAQLGLWMRLDSALWELNGISRFMGTRGQDDRVALGGRVAGLFKRFDSISANDQRADAFRSILTSAKSSVNFISMGKFGVQDNGRNPAISWNGAPKSLTLTALLAVGSAVAAGLFKVQFDGGIPFFAFAAASAAYFAELLLYAGSLIRHPAKSRPMGWLGTVARNVRGSVTYAHSSLAGAPSFLQNALMFRESSFLQKKWGMMGDMAAHLFDPLVVAAFAVKGLVMKSNPAAPSDVEQALRRLRYLSGNELISAQEELKAALNARLESAVKKAPSGKKEMTVLFEALGAVYALNRQPGSDAQVKNMIEGMFSGTYGVSVVGVQEGLLASRFDVRPTEADPADAKFAMQLQKFMNIDASGSFHLTEEFSRALEKSFAWGAALALWSSRPAQNIADLKGTQVIDATSLVDSRDATPARIARLTALLEGRIQNGGSDRTAIVIQGLNDKKAAASLGALLSPLMKARLYDAIKSGEIIFLNGSEGQKLSPDAIYDQLDRKGLAAGGVQVITDFPGRWGESVKYATRLMILEIISATQFKVHDTLDRIMEDLQNQRVISIQA